MKFEVLNRWTGYVQFTAEIECSDGARRSVEVGLAAIWAYKSGAVLRAAVLRDADLRDAVLRGVPVVKDIHQKIYAAASQPGALDMINWHSCATTHCRAGWVTTIAGVEGIALEDKIGTAEAAALIYLASDPDLGRMPDFYCGNDAALADMRSRAEAEAARKVAAASGR